MRSSATAGRSALLYAARTREQMPFLEQLSELLGDRLELFVSAEGNRLDIGAQIERLHPDGRALPLRSAAPARRRPAGVA